MDKLLLKSEKALVGKDLGRALDHFRAGMALPADAAEQGRFKKKEKLETQPKSILKHRIQVIRHNLLIMELSFICVLCFRP